MSYQVKSCHCTGKNITVYYEDTKKHFAYEYEDKSIVEDIQLYGNTYNGVQFQDALMPTLAESNDNLNEFQNKLYRDALYGLKNYTEPQLEKMPAYQKKYITHVNTRTHAILNKWKQSILNTEIDGLLKALFPESKIIKQMIEKTKDYTTSNLGCPFGLDELGISRTKVIDRLIAERVLPRNFYRS